MNQCQQLENKASFEKYRKAGVNLKVVYDFIIKGPRDVLNGIEKGIDQEIKHDDVAVKKISSCISKVNELYEKDPDAGKNVSPTAFLAFDFTIAVLYGTQKWKDYSFNHLTSREIRSILSISMETYSTISEVDREFALEMANQLAPYIIKEIDNAVYRYYRVKPERKVQEKITVRSKKKLKIA